MCIMDFEDIFDNFDWDPTYLASVFDVDFNDISNLWEHSLEDHILINVMESFENSNFMDEFALDDEYLHNVVEKIEQ